MEGMDVRGRWVERMCLPRAAASTKAWGPGQGRMRHGTGVEAGRWEVSRGRTWMAVGWAGVAVIGSVSSSESVAV